MHVPWVVAAGLALAACPAPAPHRASDVPCATCHADAVAAWSASDHARAATPGHGEHTPPGSDRALPVVAWIGVHPLRQPVVRLPDGRVQVSTAALDTRDGRPFLVATDAPQPGDWGHWTGRGLAWSTRCASCHTSPGPDDAPRDPADPARALGVTCDACHGDGRAHARGEVPAPPVPRPSADALGSCGPCHARGLPSTPSVEPGAGLLDALVPSLPDVRDGWHADGQVREETFEAVPFLTSAHAEAGLRCTTCHDPHAGGLRQPAATLCTTCHAAPDSTAHAAHTPLACVDCHMPTTVYMGRHARHDHGLHLPDRALAEAVGAPLVCDRCHTNVAAPADGGRRALAAAMAGRPVDGPIAGPVGRRAAILAALAPDDPRRVDALADPSPLVRFGALSGLDPPHAPAADPTAPAALRLARARLDAAAGAPVRGPLAAWLDGPLATPAQHLERAAWAARAGDPATRLDALRRAWADDPASTWVGLQLGAVLFEQGRREDAVAVLAEVVRRDPADPTAAAALREARAASSAATPPAP